jgi:hypothetical protein
MLQLLNSYMAELKVESLCANFLQYILFWLFKKKKRSGKLVDHLFINPSADVPWVKCPQFFLKLS